MTNRRLRPQSSHKSSLECSLSIGAVGYLHSLGSVLADCRVKGCSVCEHSPQIATARASNNNELAVRAFETGCWCWLCAGAGRCLESWRTVGSGSQHGCARSHSKAVDVVDGALREHP